MLCTLYYVHNNPQVYVRVWLRFAAFVSTYRMHILRFLYTCHGVNARDARARFRFASLAISRRRRRCRHHRRHRQRRCETVRAMRGGRRRHIAMFARVEEHQVMRSPCSTFTRFALRVTNDFGIIIFTSYLTRTSRSSPVSLCVQQL